MRYDAALKVACIGLSVVRHLHRTANVLLHLYLPLGGLDYRYISIVINKVSKTFFLDYFLDK